MEVPRELLERLDKCASDPNTSLYKMHQIVGELRAMLAAPAVERQVEQATYADKCDNCDKLTLGLSGSTKWCSYCGGKLTGETVPVKPMQIERGDD